MECYPSTGVLTVKVRAGGARTAELKENKFITSVLVHTLNSSAEEPPNHEQIELFLNRMCGFL